MKILGIEASGLVASAALWEDGVLKAEYTVNNKLTHSQTLLPMIGEMLRISGEALESVDAVAASAGPGSFTGLRIGAATAKGLALAMNIPIISLSSLRALAENEADAAGMLVVPIMDARRGQVYCGAWRDGMEVLPERACAIEELLEALATVMGPDEAVMETGEEKTGTDREAAKTEVAAGKTEIAASGAGTGIVLFLGDGVPVHRELIGQQARFPYRFAAANNQRQRAASVAQLGAAVYANWLAAQGLTAEEVRSQGADQIAQAGLFCGQVMNSDEFVPVYLRKPQAEREKDAGLLEDPGERSLKKLRRGLKAQRGAFGGGDGGSPA